MIAMLKNQQVYINMSNKTFAPAFYVDLRNAETTEDVAKAFKTAKEAAGIVCDNNDWLVDASITIVIPTTKVNKPWYKRVWNWITRKNK